MGSEVKKKWILINAKGLVLGRLASIIAVKLRGKDKPEFTPHVDCGDHIVIVNAEKIYLTKNKYESKTYFWHTGFPGGIKKNNVKTILKSKNPEKVLIKAITRMLPKNKLAKNQIKNLKVYNGEKHPHEAQKPTNINIKSLNNKNSKRD